MQIQTVELFADLPCRVARHYLRLSGRELALARQQALARGGERVAPMHGLVQRLLQLGLQFLQRERVLGVGGF